MKKVKRVGLYIKIIFSWLLIALFVGCIMVLLTEDSIRSISCALLTGLLIAVDNYIYELLPDKYNKHLTDDRIFLNAESERQRILVRRLYGTFKNGIIWSVITIFISVWFKSLLWVLPLILLYCIYSITLGRKWEFSRNAKATTCPKCKMPFSYKKKIDGKTLSRNLKFKTGTHTHNSGAFVYGERGTHSSAKCYNCGHTDEKFIVTRYEEKL